MPLDVQEQLVIMVIMDLTVQRGQVATTAQPVQRAQVVGQWGQLAQQVLQGQVVGHRVQRDLQVLLVLLDLVVGHQDLKALLARQVMLVLPVKQVLPALLAQVVGQWGQLAQLVLRVPVVGHPVQPEPLEIPVLQVRAVDQLGQQVVQVRQLIQVQQVRSD